MIKNCCCTTEPSGENQSTILTLAIAAAIASWVAALITTVVALFG